MNKKILNLINNAAIVFWDFDGVIKDSIKAKELSFRDLFSERSQEEIAKISNYHLENGGMSRRKKIEYFYKEIFKENLTLSKLDNLCKQFEKIVENRVIKSKWVPGVRKLIKNKKENQIFCLLSGTPHDELNRIVRKVSLHNSFEIVLGDPHKKDKSVAKILKSKKINSKNALFIGDANTDYESARKNNVTFVLRKNKYNKNLQIKKNVVSIDNFL